MDAYLKLSFSLPHSFYSYYKFCRAVFFTSALLLLVSIPSNLPRSSVLSATTSQMGVLVIKYFPLTSDGKNIDIAVTGDVDDLYTEVRQRTIAITKALKDSLEKASTYLGYKDSSAQPALRYSIIDTKEYTQAVPMKERRIPNYSVVLADICDYVENKNVKEVWLWAYQGPKYDRYPYLNISESKMSGPYGDISSSFRDNDMPLCKKTYRLYTFNYGDVTGAAMHSWGHQLEAELKSVNFRLFSKFQGPQHPLLSSEVGRCGSVHNPPNSAFDYDYKDDKPNKSDCLDWNPDGLGPLTEISCAVWGCVDTPYPENITNAPDLNYFIWTWQNLPGIGNQKFYKGKKLRNLWEVYSDWDNFHSNKLTVFDDDASSPPYPLIPMSCSVSPREVLEGFSGKTVWSVDVHDLPSNSLPSLNWTFSSGRRAISPLNPIELDFGKIVTPLTTDVVLRFGREDDEDYPRGKARCTLGVSRPPPPPPPTTSDLRGLIFIDNNGNGVWDGDNSSDKRYSDQTTVVRVTIWRKDSSAYVSSVVNKVDGTYDLGNLGNGEYNMQAVPTSFAKVTITDSYRTIHVPPPFGENLNFAVQIIKSPSDGGRETKCTCAFPNRISDQSFVARAKW